MRINKRRAPAGTFPPHTVTVTLSHEDLRRMVGYLDFVSRSGARSLSPEQRYQLRLDYAMIERAYWKGIPEVRAGQ